VRFSPFVSRLFNSPVIKSSRHLLHFSLLNYIINHSVTLFSPLLCFNVYLQAALAFFFTLFRSLRAACLTNLKGSVGLILVKASDVRISIPLDLSSRPFIPLPEFIHSRRPTTLLVPSLVFSSQAVFCLSGT
jgi:hypothetical protein